MTAPRNTWLRAGTSILQPYPCRCAPRRGGCSALWCPCSGRRDFWLWPEACCAWVNTPEVAARAQRQYAASQGY